MQTLPTPHFSETLSNTVLYLSAIFAVGLALAVLALGEDVHGLFGGTAAMDDASSRSAFPAADVSENRTITDNDAHYYMLYK